MAYELDYRNIDNSRWPGGGPVFAFMRFNRKESQGICIDLRDEAGKGFVRQRGYEVLDTNNNVTEFIIADTEFLSDNLKHPRLINALQIVGIAYAINILQLTPEQIIFPGGLYSVRCEQRAMRSYMRPKTDFEIACRSHAVRWVTNLSRANTHLGGMYCLDRAKISSYKNDMAGLISDLELGDFVVCGYRVSDPRRKIISLLHAVSGVLDPAIQIQFA